MLHRRHAYSCVQLGRWQDLVKGGSVILGQCPEGTCIRGRVGPDQRLFTAGATAGGALLAEISIRGGKGSSCSNRPHLCGDRISRQQIGRCIFAGLHGYILTHNSFPLLRHRPEPGLHDLLSRGAQRPVPVIRALTRRTVTRA